MGNIMINISHAKDDVEKASLGFVIANAGLTAGQESTVLLTTEGVWVATRGYTDGLQAAGYTPLAEIVANFVKNGGKIWVCGACAKPRGITTELLVEGAMLVGAAAAVEAMVNGAHTLSF
jgi:predicted peroxiredoxin